LKTNNPTLSQSRIYRKNNMALLFASNKLATSQVVAKSYLAAPIR